MKVTLLACKLLQESIHIIIAIINININIIVSKEVTFLYKYSSILSSYLESIII